MKRNLTCIICPRGCSLIAESDESGFKVTGNHCSRGKQYAISECTHPTRTVTSVVTVANRIDTMVSVKTSQPIPKEHISDVMAIIRRQKVNAPIEIGSVILSDIFGADIIATKNIR